MNPSQPKGWPIPPQGYSLPPPPPSGPPQMPANLSKRQQKLVNQQYNKQATSTQSFAPPPVQGQIPRPLQQQGQMSGQQPVPMPNPQAQAYQAYLASYYQYYQQGQGASNPYFNAGQTPGKVHQQPGAFLPPPNLYPNAYQHLPFIRASTVLPCRPNSMIHPHHPHNQFHSHSSFHSNLPHQQTHQNNRNSNQNQYHCPACEKHLPNKKQFDLHNNAHRSCPEEGCSFSATKKPLEAHLENVHGKTSKSADEEAPVIQIQVKLETPEQIEKWIQERKRKFPTESNIEKKNAEESLKKERGDIIAAEKRMKFDQERAEKRADVMAASTSSGGNDEPNESNLKKDKICSFYLKGRCKYGKSCKMRHERPRKNKQQNEPPPKPRTDSQRKPLLSMLLDADIKKEKNQVLQCIRHIVENNFFADTTSS